MFIWAAVHHEVLPIMQQRENWFKWLLLFRFLDTNFSRRLVCDGSSLKETHGRITGRTQAVRMNRVPGDRSLQQKRALEFQNALAITQSRVRILCSFQPFEPAFPFPLFQWSRNANARLRNANKSIDCGKPDDRKNWRSVRMSSEHRFITSVLKNNFTGVKLSATGSSCRLLQGSDCSAIAPSFS